MAGQIKRLIDLIVAQRAKGNPTIALTTKAKLVLKGVNPNSFGDTSPDDPALLVRLKNIAADLGVRFPTMSITTAQSTKALPDAIEDLKQQCGDPNPRVVIVFASAKYDSLALSQQMQKAFPEACVAGCSTAGEIACGRMLNGSVVALFLDEDIVEDAASAVIEDIGWETCVQGAFSKFEQHFKAPVSSLDLHKHVGLVLVDGLSGAEERLMEKIGDGTDVFFIGGSAGDDLQFQSTHVLADGKSYTNAAVLVLLRLKRGFEIVKTQSFKPTGRTLVATKVDEGLRMVIEFNHRPALDAYAETLNIAPEHAASQFFHHPLGLMIEGEPFVRSPQRVEDRSIRFYCRIKQNMELAVLETTDIVADTRAAIEAQGAGDIQGLIEFQCCLRTQQLRNENRCEQYGAIFSGVPMVGFSTYGEAYLGHINQTSTILIFR